MRSETRLKPRAQRGRSPKRKTAAPKRAGWWPLLIGIAIMPFALKAAEILPLMGAHGLMELRLLFPFPLLLKQHQFGFSEATGSILSQGMLYAQYPLYGLYGTLARKWEPGWKALLQVFAFHLLGFGVLWLLARK